MFLFFFRHPNQLSTERKSCGVFSLDAVPKLGWVGIGLEHVGLLRGGRGLAEWSDMNTRLIPVVRANGVTVC